VVTGGTLAGEALLDPLAEPVLERVHGDVAFVPCAGLDAVAGATDVSLPVAAVKRRLLLAAARRVVLVPAAGVGAVRTGAVCAVEDVDVVVTGAGAEGAALAALREAGVEVVVA
jgi:DeoR family transcriptional regulator, aga operon transcriptional repressor